MSKSLDDWQAERKKAGLVLSALLDTMDALDKIDTTYFDTITEVSIMIQSQLEDVLRLVHEMIGALTPLIELEQEE